MDILKAIFLIISGFILLLWGGSWLVDGGVAIARRFRISPLVIGMTIVAFGTSAPELLVSLISAIKGSSGIAVGNVVGSNIVNICLILGLTAVISPIVTDKKKVLSNGTVMIAASLLLPLFALNSHISRLEGITLFLGLILFTAISVRKGRMSGEDLKNQYSDKKNLPLKKALLFTIAACGLLAVGADILVDGATKLAQDIGVSDKVIGLTIVALGTSLPELAASVAAAFKKQMDISIGNIIGSNIFNILCVLGISASIKPISIVNDSFQNDFWWMIGFSVALLILACLKQGRLGRTAGIILLAGYAVYSWLLF